MLICIGNQIITSEGDVLVTYTSGSEFSYKSDEYSALYLNPEKIIDVQCKAKS